MILDYVPIYPLEAFVLITESEISIDELVQNMTDEYHVVNDSNINWRRTNNNGDGVSYMMINKEGRHILDITQIGSGDSRYFCVDKSDFIEPETEEAREYFDFHKFLRRLVKADITRDYCI